MSVLGVGRRVTGGKSKGERIASTTMIRGNFIRVGAAIKLNAESRFFCLQVKLNN